MTTVLEPHLIRPLGQALPAWPLGRAAAARLCHDTRFAPCLMRWLPGVAVHVGRRRATRPALRLHLSTLTGDLVVDLDAQARAEWALLGELVRQAEPQALACAMADELIQAAAQQRRIDTLGAQVHRIEWVVDDSASADGCPVLSLDGHELRVREVDDAFGLFVNEELPKETAFRPASLNALRLRCHLAMSERRMTRSAWRSLEPGDVLLLDGPPVRALWRVGAGCALGGIASIDWDGGRVLLSSALVTLNNEADMNDSSSDPGSIVDDIELPIHFELDTAHLRLDELAAIAPGHVIALEVPLGDAPVRLMCQGQRLGSGRLIAIGDRLGVQIESMHAVRGGHAGH